MMRKYYTSEIAGLVGLHPNTVRLYEEWGFISKAVRKENGYRMFTDVHLEQIKLARIALKGEIIQNGLHKMAINIIKLTALESYEQAIALTVQYQKKIVLEQNRAEEAIQIVRSILLDSKKTNPPISFTRKEAADYLEVTIDTLRNWERNGLFTVKRKENRYRVYKEEDIRQLKIIRSLRCANYSLASILRMLNDLSQSVSIDIKNSIDTPKENEEIISACDRLLTSLENLNIDAKSILNQLFYMKENFHGTELCV